MKDHIYYVYILTNRPYGVLYCGVTNDLIRRLAEHKNGVSSFTRRYNSHRLVWFEHHTDVEQAILREKRIKAWKRIWKIGLIEAENPEWQNLSINFTDPVTPAKAGVPRS